MAKHAYEKTTNKKRDAAQLESPRYYGGFDGLLFIKNV